jgi:hypothetical protein
MDDYWSRLCSRGNRKHYHIRNGLRLLVGHRDNEPWLGDV